MWGNSYIDTLSFDVVTTTGTAAGYWYSVFQEFTLTWLKLYCHNVDFLDLLHWYSIIWCGHYNSYGEWVGVGVLLFVHLFFLLECLELQITFFAVNDLVVWLKCLTGKIVVVHIISMYDICHNFLCNRRFSRLAKFLDCKDCYFPYHLSFLSLGQRVVVISCIGLSVPIILVNMITQSVYQINPPDWQGGEEDVEGPKSYWTSTLFSIFNACEVFLCIYCCMQLPSNRFKHYQLGLFAACWAHVMCRHEL